MLLVGALGALTFVLVLTIDGWTRPGYSPVYHPISALTLGYRGWLQTANFIVCGAAIAVGGVGAWRAGSVIGVIVVVFGVGMIASGLFPMDPMRGYPPGTPAGDPQTFSDRHRRHDSAGAVIFTCLPVGSLLGAFTLPDLGFRIASMLVAILIVAGFGLFSRAWDQDWPQTGLIQRALILLGWGWLTAVLLSLQ